MRAAARVKRHTATPSLHANTLLLSEAQGAALYDCLLPVPDHCDALCAAVAFCSGLPAPTGDCLGWCKMVSAGSPGTMAALVSCAAAAGADCAALAACLDAEP